MIKDSGERRSFETGAVRDVVEGKGRCDLLPACALLRLAKHYEEGAKKYEERNWEKGIPLSDMIDSGMRHLLKYMDGQTDEDHLCAAAWNIIGAMWMEEKKPELQNIPSRITNKKAWNNPIVKLVNHKWEPTFGEAFYSPALHIYDGYFSSLWNGSEDDYMLLKRGLVYKTKEEAINIMEDIIDVHLSLENESDKKLAKNVKDIKNGIVTYWD